MACPPIKFRKQLTGVPMEHVNCGPCAMCHAVDFATCGQIRVSPGNMRARANPDEPELATLEILRGLETFDNECRELGLHPVVAERHFHGKFSDAVKALEAGAGIIWLINYTPVNKQAPQLSGDPNFNGPDANHYIFSRGVFPGGKTIVLDSIEDARRPGIPQSPKRWPLSLIKDACAAEANGDATFIIVYRCKELPTVSTGTVKGGSRKETK